MGVKLTGADAVRRAVEALGVGMADAVEEATVKAGNKIMADARKNAPVGRRAQARTLKARAKAGGRTAGGGKARSSRESCGAAFRCVPPGGETRP